MSFALSMTRQSFNCQVKIKDIKENIPVYFKMDGNRFQHPYTLKMLNNSVFKFVVHFRPVISQIKYIKVDGTEVHFRNKSPDGCSLSEVEFVWFASSKGKVKRNKGRTIIPVEICFKDFTFVEFYLQVKYYENRKSNHLIWGRTLNHLLVEAAPTEPNMFQYRVCQVKIY